MRRALVELANGASAGTIAIVAEEPIYEWQGVLVSTSRIAVDGRSYPINDVSNVRVIEPRFQSTLAAICAGLSVVLAMTALVLFGAQFAVIAIAFLVFALGFRSAKTPRLSVDVAGERVTICASDPTLIAEIADAVHVAKRSVQSAKREPAFAGDRPLARAASVSGAA